MLRSVARILPETGILIGLWLALSYVQSISFIGQLFIFKVILVSAGAVHGHIIREFFFPYINFRDSTDPVHKITVLVIYAVTILAYSRGG